MMDQLIDIGEIGRRYFVVNSFDGVLTVLGIVMGSFISGLSSSGIVFTSCLGASLALLISGFSSAYMTERAEQRKDIKDIEGQMLEEIGGEWSEKKMKSVPLKISMVNGLSPFLTGILCASPFALSKLKSVDIQAAYLGSVSISLLTLLFLGYFLGEVSRKNRLVSAFKMLLVGLLTVVILYLLGLGGF